MSLAILCAICGNIQRAHGHCARRATGFYYLALANAIGTPTQCNAFLLFTNIVSCIFVSSPYEPLDFLHGEPESDYTSESSQQ